MWYNCGSIPDYSCILEVIKSGIKLNNLNLIEIESKKTTLINCQNIKHQTKVHKILIK
jgi:hypothetical protein